MQKNRLLSNGLCSSFSQHFLTLWLSTSWSRLFPLLMIGSTRLRTPSCARTKLSFSSSCLRSTQLLIKREKIFNTCTCSHTAVDLLTVEQIERSRVKKTRFSLTSSKILVTIRKTNIKTLRWKWRLLKALSLISTKTKRLMERSSTPFSKWWTQTSPTWRKK